MALVCEAFRSTVGGDSLDEAVDIAVSEVLSKVGSSDWPTPLSAIAGRLGVAKIEIRKLPCDGMLVPLPAGQYQIFLADWAPRKRQRFSLAHELGHAIIHSKVKETRRIAERNLFLPPDDPEEEKLCDLIASRLLMPRHLVEHFADRSGMGLDSVRELAKVADVSMTAAAIRLREFFGRLDASLAIGTARSDAEALACDQVLLSPRRGSRLALGCSFPNDLRKSVGSNSGTVRGWFWMPISRWCRARKFVEAQVVSVFQNVSKIALLVGCDEF